MRRLFARILSPIGESRHQLQPLGEPQASPTDQLPAGRIFVPQVMHSGASVAVPVTSSSSSAEEWASLIGFSAPLDDEASGLRSSVGAEPRRASRSTSSSTTWAVEAETS